MSANHNYVLGYERKSQLRFREFCSLQERFTPDSYVLLDMIHAC